MGARGEERGMIQEEAEKGPTSSLVSFLSSSIGRGELEAGFLYFHHSDVYLRF